jgi:hypothetical protein
VDVAGEAASRPTTGDGKVVVPWRLGVSHATDAYGFGSVHSVRDVGDVVKVLAALNTHEAGQQKRAKFPTSKAPFSAVFHSFRLIFGRAIISRNGLEAYMLFPERARAEHSR